MSLFPYLVCIFTSLIRNPLKKSPGNIVRALLCLSLFLSVHFYAIGQGRVVVNEFMAWSGCNTSSEFIEIMNFGPGPMNIGCYIITNGSYSVTIPPNTILRAGQYYVLSGHNSLPKDCGNIDSTIVVDLNWNTCNCIDKPITSPDGFMTDGGSANEKIVILDPQLNIIDAVSRKLPQSSSVSITTPSLSGACTSKTFDLDLMSIAYENIGQSTGINNSYSRKVDGDCGWDKTPAISAKGPNKTGLTSSASYSFSTLSASECNLTTGSISITVNAPDVASLFPMNYLLAYDADSNGVFDATDTYKYGIDSTAANININKLAYGRYRITVGSVLGCNLKT
ncbi:MAG TPA: lamin tail domain-containing protein, partial [Chitinophagaceae bacterium]|nr:lamin tail domain-containing protein [Chitinophagaceae bacterium]